MNTNKVNVIVPMAGEGSRFAENGFALPKPLIKLSGKPFFYWAISSISNYLDIENLVCILQQKHVAGFQLDKEIKKYFPKAIIKILPKLLNGAALSAYEGVKIINNDLPLIVVDCDLKFYSNDFIKTLKDWPKYFNDTTAGALLTFNSNNPRYSFAEVNEDGYIVYTAEKKVISNYAILGSYIFKNRDVFEQNLKNYLNSCNYKEYFISGIYNEIIKKNMKILNLKVDSYCSFGTVEEYIDAQGKL